MVKWDWRTGRNLDVWRIMVESGIDATDLGEVVMGEVDGWFIGGVPIDDGGWVYIGGLAVWPEGYGELLRGWRVSREVEDWFNGVELHAHMRKDKTVELTDDDGSSWDDEARSAYGAISFWSGKRGN